MGPVKWFGFALVLAWPDSATARDVAHWRVLIEEASARFGLPVAWIERVMSAESGGRTALGGRPIVSPAGAMGLMQLMPGTWADMRARLGLGNDPHAPRDNILAGTLYLRLMYERFGYPGIFGAYNAGPARYAEHLARGRRLPLETRNYMVRVTGVGPQALPASSPPAMRPLILAAASRLPPVPSARPGVFFALSRSAGEAISPAPSPSSSLWFVQPRG